MFIFSGLSLSRRSNGEKLTRSKLSADKVAGKCFNEEIERQSRYNVVEIKSALYPLDATPINRRR